MHGQRALLVSDELALITFKLSVRVLVGNVLAQVRPVLSVEAAYVTAVGFEWVALRRL